jgi:hypothetical protein
MAMQETAHSAQVVFLSLPWTAHHTYQKHYQCRLTYFLVQVGSVFVNQYYNLLNGSPDQVHKFYKDASTIGWAGSDGVMEYVTTMPVSSLPRQLAATTR